MSDKEIKSILDYLKERTAVTHRKLDKMCDKLDALISKEKS